MEPQDLPAAPHQRPSLVSVGAASSAAPRHLSVLAALDGSKPKPVARAGWRLSPALLGALVVVAAAGLWQALDGPHLSDLAMSTKAAALTPAATDAASAGARSVATGVVRIEAASAPAAGPEKPAAVQMAAVEDLPAAAVVARSAPVATALAEAPGPAPAKPAPTRVVKANAEKERPQKAATVHQPSTAAKSEPLVVATAPAARPKATVGDSRGGAKSDVQALARSQGDADVELITALVQHMDREAAERQGPTSIADLVDRCKAQPGDEALRCQRRICNNYWGRADACPASLAPTAARRDIAARP